MAVEMQDPFDCVVGAPIEMAGVVSGLHGGYIQVGLVVVLVRKRRCGLVPRRARVLGDQVDSRRLARDAAHFVGQRHEFTVETWREYHKVAEQPGDDVPGEQARLVRLGIAVHGLHQPHQHHDQTRCIRALNLPLEGLPVGRIPLRTRLVGERLLPLPVGRPRPGGCGSDLDHGEMFGCAVGEVGPPFLVAGQLRHAPRRVPHPQEWRAVTESEVAPIVAHFQKAAAEKRIRALVASDPHLAPLMVQPGIRVVRAFRFPLPGAWCGEGAPDPERVASIPEPVRAVRTLVRPSVGHSHDDVGVRIGVGTRALQRVLPPLPGVNGL